MKSRIDKSNSLAKLIKIWKENQNIVSLTFDELKKEVKDNELFISEKIDGELEGMQFDKTTKFSTKDGRIREDLPVLDEIKTILKKQKINSAIILGELAKTSSHGKPVHFNETMSAIRRPESGEEEHIEFFPFELYELNGEKVSSNYLDYKNSFKKMKKWFKDSKYVSLVEHKTGKSSVLKSVWDKFVKKEKNEGIVVRTSNGKIYKSKPVFTLDLCVIAVQEGRKKNKGKMGALILGFYDGEFFYKTVNLGVGFSDKDREGWWSLAKKYQVKKEDNVIWVDPYKMNKVIETKYKRLNFRLVDTYKFNENSWEKVDNKFSATISKPDFVRERIDKEVNSSDLRLNQIPDFQKNEKTFL
jgi:ATP-dependent DNA ligase